MQGTDNARQLRWPHIRPSVRTDVDPMLAARSARWAAWLLWAALIAGCGGGGATIGADTVQDSGVAQARGESDVAEDVDGNELTAGVDDTSSGDDASQADDASPADGETQSDDVASSDDAASDAASDTTANGGFADIVSPALFDQMFLHRTDPACEGALLSYEALVAAAATFPAFCNEGSLALRRREAAAFLANVSHETTGGWPTAPDGPYAWGLCFKEEVGCGGGGCTGYCAASATWPCAPGQTYHGRGPMQLSWNYNYGQAGAALGLNLLQQPSLVASDGTIAWRTAIWFWMTAQAPKPSCHAVMVGGWTPSAADLGLNRKPGFGMTVNIINGGLECNKGEDPRVNDRIGFYQRYAGLLAVDPGEQLDCATMASY